MKTFEILKERFGDQSYFMYRESRLGGFSHFPDFVKSRADIKNYLTNGGKLNPVKLEFTDSDGKPAKYYTVIKQPEKLHAIVDGGDILAFTDSDFISDADIIDYFRNLSERSLDAEIDMLNTDKEKASLYKQNASIEQLEGLKELIESRKTDEAFKKLCEAHAKNYFDCPAFVEFEK